MKLTPNRRKFLALMSGNGGRVLRAVVGLGLIATGVFTTGWALLLLAPGGFMIWTAFKNYCPAGLVFPEWQKEQQLLAAMPSYKLK